MTRWASCLALAISALIALLVINARARDTVLLSGQSNAVFLAPFLAERMRIETVARDSTGIAAWHADGSMWPTTLGALRSGRIRGIVWWQGESDANASADTYADELRELLGRMRAEVGHVPIILVRVLDIPGNGNVRNAQERIARELRLPLISCDGFQLDQSNHATETGYRTIAAQIEQQFRTARD